jgi:hypothetical protein
VTAAGIMTVSATTHRMTNSFAMPGPAFRTDSQIVRLYGNGGSQAPYVPVLTAPAGQRADGAAAAQAANRAFAAAARAVPGARVADYASTGNRVFLTRDGRTTYALVFTPPANPMAGSAQGQALERALTAAAPPGWHAGVTGEQLLAAGAPAGSQGQSVMAEAMIGAAGALIILLVLFASFLALLPLLIGGVGAGHVPDRGRADRDHRISQIVEYLIALIRLAWPSTTRCWSSPGGGRRAAGRDQRRGDRGDGAGRPVGGVLRADRRHRAAVADRAAGPDAAQRRLRGRAGPAGVRGGRDHAAAGHPGHGGPAP